jgi:hypothetical protein
MLLSSSWGRGRPRARQWLVWTLLGLGVDAAHLLVSAICRARACDRHRFGMPSKNVKLHMMHDLDLLIKHWWFSGKIGRCHQRISDPRCRPAPGSIPGRCITVSALTNDVLLSFCYHSTGTVLPGRSGIRQKVGREWVWVAACSGSWIEIKIESVAFLSMRQKFYWNLLLGTHMYKRDSMLETKYSLREQVLYTLKSKKGKMQIAAFDLLPQQILCCLCPKSRQINKKLIPTPITLHKRVLFHNP